MAAAPRIGRRFALTVLAAAMLALVLSPSASAAKLQVGVGRADITPPTGYYMMGWVRSDGVIIGQNTRLWARVIVLRRGGEKVALVSEDLNGIPGGMMAQAAKRVHELGFRSETSSTPRCSVPTAIGWCTGGRLGSPSSSFERAWAEMRGRLPPARDRLGSYWTSFVSTQARQQVW